MEKNELLRQYAKVLKLSKEAETLEDRHELKLIALELLEQIQNLDSLIE